jgi:hypothetical protein
MEPMKRFFVYFDYFLPLLLQTRMVTSCKLTSSGRALLNNVGNWNSTFFAYSLIIEGTTEMALQFIMPLNSIYNRNFGFIEQKMYF